MNKNIGLVLEGGGFRGCYTAGALKWLHDHDIHFDYSVAISAAAGHEFFYAAENIKAGYDIAVKGIKDKGVLGLRPIFKEGGIVGYNYLRDHYLTPEYKESLQTIKDKGREVEVGLFNMDKQELEYYGVNDFDLDKGEHIKAACVLPVSGKMTVINGTKFLDGGIRTMISIERAMATGHQKNLVIVTKDKGYVRKPNGFVLDTLLRLFYGKYKTMLANVDNRVAAYYHEMGLVEQLEKEGKTILIRPSRDTGVKRFSGSEQQIIDMYNLGWQDMEDRKEDILKFLEIE